VRTSISPTLQNLAVTELGTSLGGIVVMEPSTGEILAAAGRPLSELEPPGSTFKIITLTAVLEAHLATAHTTFADASSTVLDGFTLHNSDGETCGGTLANAFAVSCNSVFAPLGPRVGSARLVAAAQSYGFNVPSPVSIASESTIPPSSLGDDLELGDSAIGQGQVLASPLQMLRVAATIALVGRRPVPTFALVGHRFFPRVIPVSVARTVRALMRDVVSYGTGTAAQIPGVIVAGKTGTAQVITPQCPPAGATAASGASGATGATGAAACSTIDTNPHDTDAWFVAFAPEIDPRVVVAVLLPNDGVGGTTAAPLARAIIAQALADG
jgi:cell division protein FtsI/penicillin-binding protein 2